MTLWKFTLLKVSFLKIPVLLCGDYWLITKVSINCFRWDKENWKLMCIFKSYDTLKVRPFWKWIFSKSPCYRAEIIGSLKMNFLKIPVLLCGDYWIITKVPSNCFRWAREKSKLIGISKSYDTLKVHPFESEFSQNPRVIVQRLLAHHKDL